MKNVGITGGSGFIGSFNVKKFLEKGYQVRVSTTDLSKKDKYEHLQKLPNSGNLEVVQLDVQNKAELDSFLKGLSIVVHGGTPFQLNVEDPKSELLDPTIKGTENFLDAIQKTPGIEKVIFIASVAAFNTNFPMLPEGKENGASISEQDDPFMSEESHPYAQAKFIANQAVNRFIEEQRGLDFEIVTISPVFVTGKSLSIRQDSTSSGMQFLFKNKIAPDPFVQMMYDNDIEFAMVDVEDVADAVYAAATRKGLHGKNYLATSESYRVSDISLMLNNQKPKGAPKVVYLNDLAQKELGINFKPAQVPLNRFAEA